VKLCAAFLVTLLALTGGCARPTPRAGSPGAACLTAAERTGVVHFHSDSGAELAGVLLGTGRAGVVLAHGPHGDVCETLPYANVLVGLGYRVLVFDFNGFGASEPGPEFPRLMRLDRDVAAAARRLREAGAASVVLVGSEFGGLAAVIAAAGPRPAVSGVVDLSGPRQLAGLDGPAAAARLAVPALYVVSARDPNVAEVRALHDATPAALRRLELTPDDGQHALNMVDASRDPYAARVRAVVEEFIAVHSA
jgi:pimeloyl-ACP methyl ester carboxylesterase